MIFIVLMFESVSKTKKSLKVNGILKWVRKLEINWDVDKKCPEFYQFQITIII